MANVAVKFYGEGNSDGLPADYPAQVIQLGESEELPGEDWTLMTVEEFGAYKLEKQAEYAAAIAPRLLAEAKALKIAQLQQAANEFMDGHYSQLIRQQFMNLYSLAKFDNLSNRAAYIRPGIDWINSLSSYVLIRVGAINAQTTVAAVNAVAWNFAGNLQADPGLTLVGALSILD